MNGVNQFNAITIEQMETSEIDVRIPKVLFEDDRYEELRMDAKVLYGLLKDRLRLSAKNNWIDKEGRVYLEYSNGELQRILRCSKPTVIKAKQALVEYGLIFEQSQYTNADGQVANRIYLGNVISYNSEKYRKERRKRQEEAFLKRQNKANHPRKNFLRGEEKHFTGPVNQVDTNKNDSRKTDSSKDNISSRKTEKNSNEFSQSPGADVHSFQEKSEKYIPPRYYSLLNVIADEYNGKFCQQDLFTLEFQNYSLTHRQKMLIGQYLVDEYVTSTEVINLIDRMPFDCDSPLAYLMRSLENLKDQRRLEAKIVAHRQAELKYQRD